jgi:hypothetical protein
VVWTGLVERRVGVAVSQCGWTKDGFDEKSEPNNLYWEVALGSGPRVPLRAGHDRHVSRGAQRRVRPREAYEARHGGHEGTEAEHVALGRNNAEAQPGSTLPRCTVRVVVGAGPAISGGGWRRGAPFGAKIRRRTGIPLYLGPKGRQFGPNWCRLRPVSAGITRQLGLATHPIYKFYKHMKLKLNLTGGISCSTQSANEILFLIIASTDSRPLFPA